jgi:hypothetical protein
LLAVLKRCGRIAFYDLLVNLLVDEPQRQQHVSGWEQFRALPQHERARIFRVMAEKAVLAGRDPAVVQQWYGQAWRLHPADPRNLLLPVLFRLSPALCRLILQMRQPAGS